MGILTLTILTMASPASLTRMYWKPNSVFFADSSESQSIPHHRLEELVIEPETNCTIPDADSEFQCAYVQQQEVCEIVSLFPYLEAYYCLARVNWRPMLFIGYILWAVLLFVVLVRGPQIPMLFWQVEAN